MVTFWLKSIFVSNIGQSDLLSIRCGVAVLSLNNDNGGLGTTNLTKISGFTLHDTIAGLNSTKTNKVLIKDVC